MESKGYLQALGIAFLVIIFLRFSSEDDKEQIKSIDFSPTKLSDCDKVYPATAYKSEWTSSEAASVSLDLVSGVISYIPSTKVSHTSTVSWSMDQNKFFENCSPDNYGVWASACKYYQQCVSVVGHGITEKTASEYIDMNYENVAVFIKSQNSSGLKTTSRKVCSGDRCWQKTDNIADACSVVTSTYKSKVVANSIFQFIPEIDYKRAHQLGEKASGGYGECLCILHKELGIEDDYSIGYCAGEEFFTCNRRNGGAFCGRKLKGSQSD
jgi:hypothetical protein